MKHSYVTKKELAESLYTLAQCMREHSPDTIDSMADALYEDNPQETEQPEDESLWVDKSNGYIYEVIDTHSIAGGVEPYVLLSRFDTDPSRFESVPNIYKALSDFHIEFTEHEDNPQETETVIQYWGEPFNPTPLPQYGSRWSNNKSGLIYTVIGVANQHSTKEDTQLTVVYKCKHNSMWSRTLWSFMSKFKPV